MSSTILLHGLRQILIKGRIAQYQTTMIWATYQDQEILRRNPWTRPTPTTHHKALRPITLRDGRSLRWVL